MLSFHPLSLEDKPWIDKYVFASASRSADFNFGSMYMWDGRYRQLVCDFGGRLIAMAHAHGAPIFPFPVGTGELGPVVEAMRDYARDGGFPFVIRGVESEGMHQLDELFPGHFTFTDDREYSDYIYSAEKLASLAGKKLHAKRNFVNRFTQEHTWSYSKLGREHFEECLKLLERWRSGEDSAQECSVNGEHDAIVRGLDHYEELKLTGGALFAEGRMIAFTIGELIAPDTVDVHFEKAEADIVGAYAMINREFVKMLTAESPQIRFINREDDMGLDNLRQAKLSYHPEFILEKYTAHWSD